MTGPTMTQLFAALCKAAALVAGGALKGWAPEVVHLHDWQAGLVPTYLAEAGVRTPCVFTIHNIAFHGLAAHTRLAALGLPEAGFTLDGFEYYGHISALKAGLTGARALTTVSPTYAREITTPELGCGLHGLLAGLAEERRLTGILNGIDESWIDEPEVAAGNDRGADALRTGFCLEPTEGPLFGFVARIDPQKGIDILIEAARRVVDRGGQLAILGMGAPALERKVIDLAKVYRGAVGALINYAEPLARRIMTASDFLLVPSRFEPCGLTQMYAQRCGSLPIAHATGGLADTIRDGRTGFLYREPTAPAALGGDRPRLRRLWRDHPHGGHAARGARLRLRLGRLGGCLSRRLCPRRRTRPRAAPRPPIRGRSAAPQRKLVA